MLRTALLVCLLSGGLLPALAQQDSTNNTNGMNGMNGMNGAAEAVPVDSIYVRGTDTLHYTYTPAPAAATASVPVASDSLPRRRPSFLRRIVNYFGESTTDKTFEKKIDFTFAGVPATRKTPAWASAYWPPDSTGSTGATRSPRPLTSPSSPASPSRASTPWVSRATTSSRRTAAASTTRWTSSRSRATSGE